MVGTGRRRGGILARQREKIDEDEKSGGKGFIITAFVCCAALYKYELFSRWWRRARF